MKWSDQYPGKYLKAADWPQGKERQCAIDYVEREAMPDSGEEKPVLYLKGLDQGLVLNVTNGNELAENYGDEVDEWQGKPVVLYRTTTTFGKKRVPALRLRVPEGAAPQAASPADDINRNLQEAAVQDEDQPVF